MQRQLVFIPISAGELDAITGATRMRDRPAYTVTPELLDALGYGPDALEDAEYAAMVLASVAALARSGARLVLVAEVASNSVLSGEDVANGECILSELDPAAITCWFSEADDVDVTDAAAAAKDRSRTRRTRGCAAAAAAARRTNRRRRR